MSTTGIPGAPDDLVRVFVSYAREDRRWLDPDYRFSLIPFLVESLRRHRVVFWFDKELRPGDEFRRYIESEIDQSQIALLIVSQSFLNSEFIENREMPRIAERAQQGKMIIVPVLVEPCDWSEYPFLADRQMVPSSPLIDYTESEPQWAKVRYQILDGLKAQLKRIREAPQSPASSAAAHGPAEREASALATSLAEQEAARIRQQREREAEEHKNREKEQEELRLREAVEREAAAQAAARTEAEAEQIRERQEREARVPEPALQPETWPDGSSGRSRESDAAAAVPFSVAVAVEFSEPTKAPSEIAPEFSDTSEPVKVPTFGMTTTPPDPREEWNEDQTQVSLVERKKARIPREWMIAIAGGAVLVVALVLFLVFLSSGKPWTALNSGTTNDLYSISGTSDGKRLWAVGQSGTILESEDGGATWTPRNSGTTWGLARIFGASDGMRLWVVGDHGTILESDDGGATWKARKSDAAGFLWSISGTSDGRRLWAVGDNGTILESDDGGANWIKRNSGTTDPLESIFGTSDGQELWVVGDRGWVIESNEEGANLLKRNIGTFQELNSIFGTSDGQHLWAVGEAGQILKSDDRGTTWTWRDSGTTNNLFSIFGASDGQHLWAAGDGGTILRSEDGGATWKASRSGTANELRSIFGTSDGKHLWVVGDNGTILELNR